MTPEMRASRAGKLTASCAGIIMGGLKTDGLERLVKRLAWERVYGIEDEPGYQSKAMERGQVVEPEAREWYEFAANCEVEHDPDATVDHATIPWVAASPDAIRDDRVVEIKSPMQDAFMESLDTGEVPSVYRWQVRWQMFVCDVRLCDFVIYHPKAGGRIIQVHRDAKHDNEIIERLPLIESKIAGWVHVLRKGAK